MATQLYDITAADWQLRLGQIGEVVEGLDDIEQCIQIVLRTPKGSVPHRPDFGSELFKYLDAPINLARPAIVGTTVEAIRQWEQRVTVKRVLVDQDGEHLTVQVQYAVNATSSLAITEITV